MEPALPPGPQAPRPVQTLRWIARPGPLMDACRRRYGDVFTLRLANETSWVMLADPAAVRQVFTGDPAQLHAGEANAILRPLLGERSVLLLDGDAHLAERRRLLPAFHGERVARYRALVTEVTERDVAAWPTREPFALLPRMQALTLEVIVRAVFGVHDPVRGAALGAALRRVLDWLTEPRHFLALALLGPERTERLGLVRRVLAPVEALLGEELARRRADPALRGGDDVLALLLEVHDDPRALRDELLTLLVAGHETTASALSWAIERLVRHPEAWARVRTGDEAYLEAVVKETLRLRPVLTLVLRKLTAPLEVAGHLVPAGAALAPCIYLLHRRPDLYPDPLAFRPERFLETPAGTYSWIPFGGGTRRCLGASFALLEMRTVLAAIAARAPLRPAEAAPEPPRRRAVTLTPGRGARVLVG